MSGVEHRLTNETMPQNTIHVKGFNDSTSPVTQIGLNSDAKHELYIPSMPSDLVLLCAADYTQSGATILFPTDGYVLSLTAEEQAYLRNYADQKPHLKQLTVRNNTYEVLDPTTIDPNMSITVSDLYAYNSTATKFFNSKVNVSSTQERILATLLTGLTFKDLLTMSKNNSVLGLPRDITPDTLHTFENRYGRTPDVLQLAFPNLAGNTKGYFAPKEVLTSPGQRIEADYFEPEFNDVDYSATADPSLPPPKKLKKLQSFGGARAKYAWLDCYTGYANGILVTSMKNSLPLVQSTIEAQKARGFKTEVFSADQGILSQALFRVAVPAVQQYLKEQDPPITPECGEAHNHNNGTPYIEHLGRQLKELERFGVLYVLRNPNFSKFKFTKVQILKLWGELFYWALFIINLKPAYNDPTKTRWEAYLGFKPDLRILRLLPIFSSLYVYRRAANAELQSMNNFWQFGLYVGPSTSVPGAIRAAVLTNNKELHIITTSAIKGVSDGGQVSIYPTPDVNVNCLYEEDTRVHDPTTIAHIPDMIPPIASNRPLPTSERLASNAPASPPQRSSAAAPSVLSSHTHTSSTTVAQQLPLDPVQTSLLSPPPDVNPVVTTAPLLLSNPVPAVSPPPVIPAVTATESQTSVGTSGLLVSSVAANPKLSQSRSKKSVTFARLPPVPPQSSILHQYNTRKRPRPIASAAELLAYSACLLPITIMPTLMDDFNQATTNIYGYAYQVDWTDHVLTDEPIYCYSFTHNAYLVFDAPDAPTLPEPVLASPELHVSNAHHDAYRAVKVDVPRTFKLALAHPKWGEPAHTELRTLTEENKAMVRIDANLAKKHIEAGAEVLYMLPVYEEKIKDGKVVHKVRLVANGKHHNQHGPTYSPTPSREELLVFLHICATLDCDYYHLDEKRAFLTATKKDDFVTLARIAGDPSYYHILKALYGLKTSPHDYNAEVQERMHKLGYLRLHICSSIYYIYDNGKLLLVYVYVDDYVFMGTDGTFTLAEITKFRTLFNTTEPDKNATRLLGMEIDRDRARKIITVRMQHKISELAERFPHAVKHPRNVPMPQSGYLVYDDDFANLPSAASTYLTQADQHLYMQIVGCLIWIEVIRPEIIFVVLYLSWFTHKPRQHHMNMSLYCIGYLYTTIDLPLVLGGISPLQLHGWADASLGTGPRRRSVIGEIATLGPSSGAIHAKATTSTSTCTSSFEAELDALSTILKTLLRLRNILKDLLPEFSSQGNIYSDNKALVDFVNTEQPMVKGVRHVEMRFWFTRDTLLKGQFVLTHMSGDQMPADHLTKLGNIQEHRKFTQQILGLTLLEK